MSNDLITQAEELLQKRDHRAARATLEKILAKAPDDIHALHLLSTLDIENGMLGLALEKIDRVLARDPDHAPAIYNRGVCLLQRRDPAALDLFRRAVELDPRHPGALYNIGFILRARGQLAEAASTFAKLVEVSPNWSSARDAYCDTLLMQGEFHEVLAVCDVPVQQGKANATTFRLRASALHGLNRHAEADEEYRRSLQLDGSNPDTLHAFGALLQQTGRFSDAVVVYEREVVLAGQNRALADRFDPALGEIIRSSRHACHWKSLTFYEDQALKRVREASGSIDPLLSLMITDDPRLQQTAARKAWPRSDFEPTAKPAARHGDRLRIGYLIGPYVTQRLAAIGETHDKKRFDIIGYNVAVPSIGDRAKAAFASYRELTDSSNEQVADTIVADNLDVLVDVMGHTAPHRLGILLHKPAPVIAHFMGFQGTLGTKAVDYLFADHHTIKPGEEAFYDESIVRLPESCRPFDATRKAPGITRTRAELGLKDGAFVFCAFAEPMLLSPQLFDSYAAILKDVPESQLWLLDFGDGVRANLRNEATARGIDGERLIFARGTPDELLEVVAHADLFLDAWPYTGHALTSDALWAGVPVVTRTGRSFASRLGASQLKTASLPELVTADAASFQALAVQLAKDPARLGKFRTRLSQGRASNPLFDTRRFTAGLEQALETMVGRQRKGHAAESFAVAAPK